MDNDSAAYSPNLTPLQRLIFAACIAAYLQRRDDQEWAWWKRGIEEAMYGRP